MSDPKRLVDDPQTSTIVRDTLSLGQQASLPEYDATKGLERFLLATAPVAAAGVGGWTLARALKLLVTKWWSLGIVGTVAVGGASYVVYEQRAAAPAATVVAPPAPAAPAKLAEPSPLPSSSPAEAPAAAPTEEPQPLDAPGSVAPSTPGRSINHAKPTADERVQREVKLLGRARAALAKDPAEALARTQEGEREFPQGVLSEEREAIAVLALGKLGRAREAQTRGAAFLKRYPNGPFSARVRVAITPTDQGPVR